MSVNKLKYLILAVFLSATVFTACGGGGTATTTTSILSGTVAAGAPVVGMVDIGGMGSNAVFGDIDSDGKYSIDVSDITPPYFLFATGIVNGRTIELYSFSEAAGNINITPITDLIVAKALGETPNLFTGQSSTLTNTSITDNYRILQKNFNSAKSNTSAITIGDNLDSAKAKVAKQLKPILDVSGVSVDEDLMSAKFDADHTKMDAVLDALEITFDALGTTATIRNKYTGTTIIDKVDDPTDDQDFGSSEIAATQEKIIQTAAINVLSKTLTDLFVSNVPTAGQLDATWWPLVADDFLDGGSTKSETRTAWTGGKGPVGMKFTASIIRDMTTAELLGTPYSKGLLINLPFYMPDTGESGNIKTFVVWDGISWLWFGDHEWVDLDIMAMVSKIVAQDGTVTFQTGWAVDFDDAQNYAFSQGVRSVIIAGAGLPSTGVIMDLDTNVSNFSKSYTGTSYTSMQKNFNSAKSNTSTIINSLNDANLLGIQKNSEYTAGLYAELSGSVSLGNTPLRTMTVNVPSKPLLNSKLTGDLFPTITSPTSHNIAAANIPGQFTVSWAEPVSGTAKIHWALIEWQKSSGTWNTVLKKISQKGQTSITLDTSSFTSANPSSARIQIGGRDVGGLLFITQWDFQ